ncbi:MAG: bifunctional riboflavin kinase/FAD synthetase [Pirellulales bacterium]|nr:bifunctional riboflavin kinase/FAD synthetase [Pirellulales bacterium]
MNIVHSLDDFPPALRGGAVAIGNFDGVHRGHARLIERLTAMARSVGGPAVAFTFDPHPVSILRPDAAPMPLIWTERKIEILAALGVDAAIAYPTNREFLELDARQFFDHIVREKLQAKAMVEGPNFYFGHNRSGNVEVLRRFCAEAGLPFEVTAPLEIDDQIVSSSRVRKMLLEGRATEAAEMLGRPHRIRGRVVPGAGRGAKLGFPTANVERIDTLLPPDGIYAGKAWIESPEKGTGTFCRNGPKGAAHKRCLSPFPAAISLGVNPTFGEQAMKVEAYLLDFQGDLYGRPLQIDFIARLRDTVKFNSVADLIAQMAIDVEQTRKVVGC